jgi:hypothetical protein
MNTHSAKLLDKPVPMSNVHSLQFFELLQQSSMLAGVATISFELRNPFMLTTYVFCA